MGKLIRLTDNHLLSTIAKFPSDVFNDDSKRSFFLAVAIIKHFLGNGFLDRHISPERDEPGFLRVDLSKIDLAETRAFRVVDLAEMLFNLQHVEGFDDCIARMEQGAIEPTYAELDLGRLLRLASIDFRYVTPVAKRECDYDVEMTLPDGVVVCADAKCKLEATEFSEDTVLNALRAARTQFPKDRPSFVFVKVPADWLATSERRDQLTRIAERFLSRDTRRVVSVKYYASRLRYEKSAIEHLHTYSETPNKQNRFDNSRDWQIFHMIDRRDIGGWNHLPSHWRRILYYPRDMMERA